MKYSGSGSGWATGHELLAESADDLLHGGGTVGGNAAAELGLLLGSLVRGVYRVHIQGYPLKYDIKHGAEQKQHAENA